MKPWSHFWIVLPLWWVLFGSGPLWAQTYAYVPSYEDDRVLRIDTDSEEFDSVDLADGCGPYGAAVMPNGSYVLVTCTDNDTLVKITNANFEGTGTPVALSVGVEPRGVAIESSGGFAFVANYDDDTVSEIRLSTFAVSDSLSVGNGPWGVAAFYEEVDQTVKVYVTNYLDNTISVISDSSTEDILSGGFNPIGVAITPNGRFLYVANFNGGTPGTVAIIRTSDNTLTNLLNLTQGPWGVAVGSEGAAAYVTNSESVLNVTTAIATSTQSVSGSYNAGNRPLGVAAPMNGDFAYVVNQLGNSITKIDNQTQIATEIASGEISGAFALGAFIGGTPPAAPTDLEATTESYSRIGLTWTDNATDELGYKVERRIEGEDAFNLIIKLPADTTTYSDGGLLSTTTYEYRLRAYNEAANSDYSNTASATTSEGQFSWCFVSTLLN